MDWQPIATGALSLISALMGWILKSLWSAVGALRDDLTKLAGSLPDTYARKDDTRDMFRDLLEALRRIEDKLDRKADK